MCEANLGPSMNEKSCDNCAYKIDKRKLHLYKHTFLWTIIIATLSVIALFVIMDCQYAKYQERIVEIHKNYCKNINYNLCCIHYKDKLSIAQFKEEEKNISDILQLQYNKQQSDFTVISIWGGILMIVFLVFSIYSVYKTDEIMKESKSYMDKIENNSEKSTSEIDNIHSKVESAIKSLREVAEGESKKMKTDTEKVLDDIKVKINSSIKEKSDEFGTKCKMYTEQMERSAESYRSMTQNMIKTIKEDGSASSKDAPVSSEDGSASSKNDLVK
jgi:hypothetical protein